VKRALRVSSGVTVSKHHAAGVSSSLAGTRSEEDNGFDEFVSLSTSGISRNMERGGKLSPTASTGSTPNSGNCV
jgi:hypothetical protein